MIHPWRLATIGITFLALFTMLSVRLWFLQVAAVEENTAKAASNQVQVIYQQPARGEIRDINGTVLAGSRPSQTLQLDRAEVTLEQEEELVQRLAVLLGVEQSEIRNPINSARSGTVVTLARDISDAVAFEVQEYQDDYPGISVALIPVRYYAEETLAAHVLGYTGKATTADLERYSDRVRTDEVFGRSGVERQYDNVLRGTEGAEVFTVSADRTVWQFTDEVNAQPGWNVVLTIDADVSRELKDTLQYALELSREQGEEPTGKVAGLVLDATDGSVVAMESTPDYDPNAFIGGLSEEEFEVIQENDALLNLNVRGTFPPGSTFKAVPYVVAIEENIWPDELNGPEDGKELEPKLEFPSFGEGSPQVFTDWSPDHGWTNLHGALVKSADVYFWEVALGVWEDTSKDESIIQEWARELGYGAPTGIDLPGEASGIMPDRDWRERLHEQNPIAFPNGEWYGGDLMNTVIGQGDLAATPLQLAVSYAALVNGGTVWRPRVVDHFVDTDGNVVDRREPAAVRQVDIDPETSAMLRRDLAGVVTEGTAAGAFADSPYRNQIGGKTGTAQIGPIDDDIDTSWFVGVAPISNPKYVVVIVVDEGGGGSAVAAPAVRRVLEYMLDPATAPRRVPLAEAATP
ncbi:MAG: penicillin-binding protein 2 [Acidimicrobiia bacterium]|nr:penicillin-binding protein 2 [Acidimicrobiia bacterium]MBT8194447.1 penicillin-binding protein 2 [Acidimicrobiia bacterium]NNF88512.1 penicillin-binding protein 2 [Acidimicrobiia bacterium]NNL13651.1 penicillin-binding protein 2 [Acidimicrobiia bacterium]NNL98165.1 penicillin-binding protein 2 [Acidimicrobiia bacterium]